jgi:hypothetical protein
LHTTTKEGERKKRSALEIGNKGVSGGGRKRKKARGVSEGVKRRERWRRAEVMRR